MKLVRLLFKGPSVNLIPLSKFSNSTLENMPFIIKEPSIWSQDKSTAIGDSVPVEKMVISE
jgi:hypothetical protein